MKQILILFALLIGLSDGSIAVFPGSPFVLITPIEITIEGMAFPIKDIKAFRYVPDSLVM
jgi:hypothetical protein